MPRDNTVDEAVNSLLEADQVVGKPQFATFQGIDTNSTEIQAATDAYRNFLATQQEYESLRDTYSLSGVEVEQAQSNYYAADSAFKGFPDDVQKAAIGIVDKEQQDQENTVNNYWRGTESIDPVDSAVDRLLFPEAWYDDPEIPRYTKDVEQGVADVKYQYNAKKHMGKSLSAPSKMPGPGYSIDPKKCHTGSKLRGVEGSVCQVCYGMKGNYVRFPVAGKALCNRLNSLVDPEWVPSMVMRIRSQTKRVGVFRWHDVGDLKSINYLFNIICVVKATPNIRHWLPTKEIALVRSLLSELKKFPENLCIRFSRAMIGDMKPFPDFPSSHVIPKGVEVSPNIHVCPAPQQEGECKDCRWCWDGSIKQVGYPKH